MTTLKAKTNERFYREIQYKDSSGTAIDITGYSIDMDIKTKNGVMIENLSVGSGIALTTPLQGQFTVTVADCSAWITGMAVSDLVITDDSGNEVASETFNINIIQGITRV